MNKNIVVIEGDGIGPEVTRQSLKVLNAVSDKFNHESEYRYCLMGADAIDKTGNPLPDETIEACLNSDAILFGAIGHPKYDNDPSAKVRPEQGLLKLRRSLQLFANIRPINAYPSLHHLAPLKSSILEDVDFVIFRELTGGIYFGKKELSDDGTQAIDECIYTKKEIERVADLAFQFAQKPGRRKKLTLVDKANVLETSRLWRKTVQEVAKRYANVKVDYLFVDNAAMQIIQNPKQFDVILTENMFGDIISDEASVLSGSLGLLPSASVGEIVVYTHNPVSVEIVLELVGRRVSVTLCEAARELGLDLFGPTLTLSSILVDLGEFELHAVDRTVPTLDRRVIVCTLELIDHVLIELNLLDLGVDRRRRRFEGIELLEVGAVACGLVSSSVVSAHAVNDRDDQGQEQQQE